MSTELTYKKPSALLVSMVKKGAETISMYLQHRQSAKLAMEEIIDQGRKEGIGDKQLGEMLRTEMKNRGLSDRTIRKYLPAELKNPNMIRKNSKPKREPWLKEYKLEFNVAEIANQLQNMLTKGVMKGYFTHDNKRITGVEIY